MTRTSPPLPTDGATLELTIDGFDDEGRGRAVIGDGPDDASTIDVAVRGALPGDVVRAKVERSFPARRLVQARTLEVVAAGPLHVERSCPHPAPCPGCPLEGASAGFALELKRERVARALVDAGLEEHAHLVEDVVPALAPRQKVKLTAGGRAGALRFGLFVPHSHRLIGAEACPHQDEAITEVLDVLRPVLDATGLPPATLDPTGIKAIILRRFREGVGAVVVTGAPVSDESFRHLVACMGHSSLVSLAVRVDERGGNSLVGGDVQHSRGPQRLTPLEAPATGGVPETVDAFCQTDPERAQWLYHRVAAFLVEGRSLSPAERRYADLYAGTGGFSRALLSAGAELITAVERAPASAESLAPLPLEGLLLSVEDALPILEKRAPLHGLVADPPKSGLKDAARPLAKLGATRVALVACDPDAGARDAKIFVDEGYRLLAIEPVDLFPATPEVETLFLLEKP